MTEQKKPTFDKKLIEEATTQINKLVEDTPELESVALVLSYSLISDSLPYCIMTGQGGTLRNPAEIVKLTQQTLKTLNYQLGMAQLCIQNMDQYMGEQAKELQKLQDQINAAKQTIANTDTGGDTNAG